MPRMPSLIAFVASAVNMRRVDYWPNEVLMSGRIRCWFVQDLVGGRMRWGEDLGALLASLTSWCERARFEPFVREDAHRTGRVCEHLAAKGLPVMAPAPSRSNPAPRRTNETILHRA